MNTANTRHPSGPECARYRSLLPQFRQGTLSPADERNLRAHLATCAYCRAHLTTYDRLDAALRISLDRYTPTTPAAIDLVRSAVARVSPASSAAMDHHQPQTLRVRQSQRENAMFDPRNASYGTPTMPQTTYRPPRNTRTRPVLATIAALLLIGLAAALFSMFARPGSNPAQTSTPTATTQATATTQPTATLQPTQNTTVSAVDSGHPCSADTSGQTSYVYLGDLKVSRVQFALAYPANQLPSNLDPSKPYQRPDNLPNPPNPPVNPIGGYSLTVCNTSGFASHVIRSLTVRIAAFSAYSGPLNTYMFCDEFYQRPNGIAGGGCGGGMTLDEQVQASFAANATVGAQVTTTQDNTFSGLNAPQLPVSLGPGQMLIIALKLTPSTAPGVYTFAFGLNYDAVTSAPISTMQPILFDSAAVKWNGQNCTKPALLSQIPATDTTNKYICAP